MSAAHDQHMEIWYGAVHLVVATFVQLKLPTPKKLVFYFLL